MQQEILFLEPVFTHNIWGGTKLRTEFCYDIDGDDIGECWGIAAHEHGDCHIRSGIYKGMTLSELWENHPKLFGQSGEGKFPLLVKILDAKDDLSVQVHPDDVYAKKNENGSYGKAECWYILECDENATLVLGHHAKSNEELCEMVNGAKWKKLIREVPVKKGDFIQLNPGTMHAIKGGIMLLETQQNSDITYRVYDYDRMSNGKLRELHVEKSLDVIEVPATDAEKMITSALEVPKNQFYELINCQYYKVYKIDVQGEFEYCLKVPFLLMSVIEGTGKSMNIQ